MVFANLLYYKLTVKIDRITYFFLRIPVSAGSAGNDEVLFDKCAGAQEPLLVAGQLLHDGGHPAVQNRASNVSADDSVTFPLLFF